MRSHIILSTAAICLLIFISSIQPALASSPCEDSDQYAPDPYRIKGSVTYETVDSYGNHELKTEEDKCKTDGTGESTYVVEYTCEDYLPDQMNPKVSEYKNCLEYGEFFTCLEGRCVDPADIIGPDDPPEIPETSNCTDSDKGEIFVAGSTVYIQDGKAQTPVPDWCDPSDDTKLNEVTCEDGKLVTKSEDCPMKCVNGACDGKAICSDPDGDLGSYKVEFLGFDIYEFQKKYGVKSTTSSAKEPDGTPFDSATDTCAEDTSDELTEYYCDGWKIESKVKDCDDYDVDTWIPFYGDIKVNFVCSAGKCCPDKKWCVDTDGGEAPEEKGVARIMSCVVEEQTDPAADTCGIAVCSTTPGEPANTINDIACPADTGGNSGMTAKILTADGKYGDYVKEFNCYDNKVVYSWKKCAEGTICQEGACKAVETTQPQKIFVELDGTSELNAGMTAYCMNERISMRLMTDLHPVFLGGDKSVTPEIYAHFDAVVCDTFCVQETGLCEPKKLIKHLPDTQLNVAQGIWTGPINKLKKRLFTPQ